MNKLTILALFVANSVVSAGLSYLAYKKAADLPAAPQVALVDISAIVNTVKPDDPLSKERAKVKIGEIKEQAKQLAAMGVIVLDASSVIEAPDEAYIGLKDARSADEKGK